MREESFLFNEIISVSIIIDSALLWTVNPLNLKTEFLYIKIKIIQ